MSTTRYAVGKCASSCSLYRQACPKGSVPVFRLLSGLKMCSSPRRSDTLHQHYTLHGGKMKLELKKRIVKTLIWSTVLYAAETWTLESGHSTTGIVQNVDLEKVNENKLD